MVILSRIEMQIIKIIFSASPNNRYSQPESKSGLEIYSTTMTSEVGHKKTAFFNLCNNTVTNFIIVLKPIHYYWMIIQLLKG